MCLKKNFPKHHLQDAGKCMGKKTNSLEKTENIPYRFPKLNKYCHKFVGRVK